MSGDDNPGTTASTSEGYFSSRDFDGDGNIDLTHTVIDGVNSTIVYDDGNILAVEQDVDNNGTYESVTTRSEDGFRTAIDANDDGYVDFAQNFDEGGHLYREDQYAEDGSIISSSVDVNGDGWSDADLMDTNGDGFFDAAELDTDGDGILNEVLVDTDGDGVFNMRIADTDNDGTLDYTEFGVTDELGTMADIAAPLMDFSGHEYEGGGDAACDGQMV